MTIATWFGRILRPLAFAAAVAVAFTWPAFAVTSLNVTVTEDAQALPGSTLNLTFPDGATQTFTDEDGDGTFQVTLENPGQYYAAIVPPQQQPVDAPAQGEGKPPAAQPEAEGEPVASEDAQVSVEGVSGTIYHEVVSDAAPKTPQLFSLNVPEEGQLDVTYDWALDPAPKVYLNGVNTALLEAIQPIEVGPKADVGTESTGKKVASGIAKSVLGGFLGGGGGGSKRSSEPKPKRDPVRKTDPAVCTSQNQQVEGEVRTGWVNDGLLVSTNISEHPDKGTFQAIFLVDEYGNVLPPARFEIYKIWAKHTLTVSWTKSTYVDGQLVSQETGGWTESWLQDLGTFKRRADAQEFPPIWALMGYDRAHAGVQRLGAVFQITPEQLAAAGRVWIVAHITMPQMDPVMTTPLVAELVPGADGALDVSAWALIP